MAIKSHLLRVLDLTNPVLRRKLGLTLKELAAEDWRKLLAAGKESLTQMVGRAVANSEGSGLLVPSAAVSRGVNVVVFPSQCAANWMTIVEGEKLEKMRLKTKV